MKLSNFIEQRGESVILNTFEIQTYSHHLIPAYHLLHQHDYHVSAAFIQAMNSILHLILATE